MEEEERIDLHQYYKKPSLSTLFLLPSLDINKKIVTWENLNSIGYVSLFLKDLTEGNKEEYYNCLLMVINPSCSFKQEKWEDFHTLMEMQGNYVTCIEYDKYVYGIWMRINPIFGDNLKELFQKGLYSKFPKNYVEGFLPDYQQKVCKRDEKLQKKLEKLYNLEEGFLHDVEFAEKPTKEDYEFVYMKIEKNEEINNS